MEEKELISQELQQLHKLVTKLAMEIAVKNMRLFHMTLKSVVLEKWKLIMMLLVKEPHVSLTEVAKSLATRKSRIYLESGVNKRAYKKAAFQLFLSVIERLQPALLNIEKTRLELEYQREQIELRTNEIDKREIQIKSEHEKLESLMREIEDGGDDLQCLETLNQTPISKEHNAELQEARKALIHIICKDYLMQRLTLELNGWARFKLSHFKML
ncbi:Cortactin-binding protein 2 [Bienertia sinuspersici]